MLFQVIGYFALLVFDQGLDVLRELSFNAEPRVIRQAFFAWLGVSWWSWQSWRSSRMILHFSYFNFWAYQPMYALRAQVLIPRLLGVIPFLILARGVVNAQEEWSTFAILLVSSAVWLFVFYHFRRRLIVYIRSLNMRLHGFIPDYVPIKNGVYPSRFIWAKQWKWIIFRIAVLLFFFLVFIFRPVETAQYIGSSAVVLFGFGSWLILAALMSMLERHIHFPVSFSIFIAVVVFSFFNNNHTIRTTGTSAERPTLSGHFENWLKKHQNEPQNIYLVAAEGGGIRSAYWTSGILSELHTVYPDFHDNVYAISSVSGGSLGAMIYETLRRSDEPDPGKSARQILRSDFLAPVTAGLIFPDILQKFIPFPIDFFDRARVLENSWEKAWRKNVPSPESIDWSAGFIKQFGDPEGRVLLMNSTHVESGYRTVVSNVDLKAFAPMNMLDFFEIQGTDIPISTAVGLSARFPLLTPPARVALKNDETWGHLVDGGYYENIGANTLMDVYSELRNYCLEIGIDPRFRLIVIRNTKVDYDFTPVRGMSEVLPPFVTFSNIWAHNGVEVIRKGRKLVHEYNDELVEIKLKRSDQENIPLGWYLSPAARKSIERQIRPQLRNISGQ